MTDLGSSRAAIIKWRGVLASCGLVSLAVLSAVAGIVFTSSLSGSSNSGEEGYTVVAVVILFGISLGTLTLAGWTLSRTTRLVTAASYGFPYICAAAWIAGEVLFYMSGLMDLADALPSALSIAVVTGLTIPVFLLAVVGLLVLSVFGRPTR